MRKVLSPAVILLVISGLALSGCVTSKQVDEKVQASEQRMGSKIGEVQTQVEANQAEIGKLHEEDAKLAGQIDKLSATAKDALKRAEEAGKLAKGKFLYEVTMTDNDVKFGFDKYGLSDEAKAALDAFAQKIKAENDGVYIEIQGHTDNIGSEKYNLELGYKRAEQVLRYLNMEQGFPLHRMNVISYGEYKPAADNSSVDGRKENRRVTMVVME
jgi:outer membrane protein OmpA-like peptidoglycan-associated protein